jgi:glycosyltransferase involved in cell wall biosynthesis
MRVGFYDPYLAILGGGEKYLLSILEQVCDEWPAADVVVLSPEEPDPAAWERLGVHVARGAIQWERAGMLGVTPRSRRLDLLVTITNHFPPLSLARRSAVIVQFPFAGLGGLRGVERRLRLRSYDTVLCYSEFVREHIVERLGVDSAVISPPVDTDVAVRGEKGRSIVAVGRFFPAADANNKKHGVLIEAFRRLFEHEDGVALHLAGGCHSDPGSQAHLAELREQAAGLPVEFHPNASAEALEELYAGAALFWHAAGSGETLPERLEHFGITTVEAMARGCVPVVPASGGQLEIVADGENGRLWGTVDELVGATRELLDDPAQAARLRAAAVRDAERFAKPRFRERVRRRVLEPAGLAPPARTPG